MGTHEHNKKAGIPTTTEIPATKAADYRGNFGLARRGAAERTNGIVRNPSVSSRLGESNTVDGFRECHSTPWDEPGVNGQALIRQLRAWRHDRVHTAKVS